MPASTTSYKVDSEDGTSITLASGSKSVKYTGPKTFYCTSGSIKDVAMTLPAGESGWLTVDRYGGIEIEREPKPKSSQ